MLSLKLVAVTTLQTLRRLWQIFVGRKQELFLLTSCHSDYMSYILYSINLKRKALF